MSRKLLADAVLAYDHLNKTVRQNSLGQTRLLTFDGCLPRLHSELYHSRP